MTAIEDVTQPSRGRLAALVAAGVLVVVVVGAVLLFGVQRPPTLEGLAAGPPPPAAVAWTESRGNETCLSIAWPDGETTRPWCDPQGGEVVAWPDPGAIWVRRYGATMQLLEVDPVSGAVLQSRRDSDPDFRGEKPLGEQPQGELTSYRDGDELVVSFDDREVWRTAAPPNYDLRLTRVSPDGEWAVMADAGRRLLVIELGQSAEPRVWVAGVDLWGRLVWQGEVLED